MVERGLVSCEACGFDTAPPGDMPAAQAISGFARRALGKAMGCAVLAGALWACAPAWITLLPHLPEHLPIAWQAALGQHSLSTAQSRPEPSFDALGPVLRAAKARGELVVAVRHYRRPAIAGAQAPLEPDRFDTEMAGFLSTRLGLPLRLIPANSGAPAADLVIAGALGVDQVDAARAARIPTAYTGGAGALLVLRGSPLARVADLRGQRICVPAGSPYARALAERHGANVHPYAAAVQAVAGFMAGECQALADDELTVERLMRAPEWRFYRRLDVRLQPDNRTAQIALGALADQGAHDARSIAWLDEAVRQWKTGGALIEARQHRAADVAFEASQLQDGLVCHS